MIYFVYYESDDEYDTIYGLERCADKQAVERFINENPNYKYTVINGREEKIKVVSQVTKLEIE